MELSVCLFGPRGVLGMTGSLFQTLESVLILFHSFFFFFSLVSGSDCELMRWGIILRYRKWRRQWWCARFCLSVVCPGASYEYSRIRSGIKVHDVS